MTIHPIRKTVTVPLPPERAFTLFTAEIDRWWPRPIADPPDATPGPIAVEPGPGGRITESCPDGLRVELATVTDWQPGRRFGFHWYLGRDKTAVTDVSVEFLPDADGTTVVLTHSGFDRLDSRPGPGDTFLARAA